MVKILGLRGNKTLGKTPDTPFDPLLQKKKKGTLQENSLDGGEGFQGERKKIKEKKMKKEKIRYGEKEHRLDLH